MIKLVAFDLDGTIGDTVPMCIEAFKQAVEPHTGHELSQEEVIQTFGLNEEGMIKQVVADDWERVLDEFYVIYEELHRMCPRPFEGINELLNELKKELIIVALITGKGERSCAITLNHFGMELSFDKIETGSAIKNRKSEAIGDLLKNYNLNPAEMIYIGDAVSDITACREAGIKCLSAAWAVSGKVTCQLETYNPNHVFYSIEALRFFLMGTSNPNSQN